MKDLSIIAKTTAKAVFPLILLYGFYLVMHGHLAPGGGFQGGAVIASALALIIVVYSGKKAEKKINHKALEIVESSALIAFIGLAFLGIGIAFFSNFLLGTPVFGDIPPIGPNAGFLNTGGTVTLMGVAVGFEVMCALGIIVLVMALGSLEVKK